MIVVCLEGCHGCGKSSLCKEFEAAGFEVLDEAFMDMPNMALHPQSLTMEVTWLSNWFMRLLQRQTELNSRRMPDDPEPIFIADRSPYSAAFYASNGGLLDPIIKEQIRELRAAGITILNVYLQVTPDLLWSRIQQRLQAEPHRVKYNEDSREWMEATVAFYEQHEWDCKLENNDNTLVDLMHSLIGRLTDAVPRFFVGCPRDIQRSPVHKKRRRALLVAA